MTVTGGGGTPPPPLLRTAKDPPLSEEEEREEAPVSLACSRRGGGAHDRAGSGAQARAVFFCEHARGGEDHSATSTPAGGRKTTCRRQRRRGQSLPKRLRKMQRQGTGCAIIGCTGVAVVTPEEKEESAAAVLATNEDGEGVPGAELRWSRGKRRGGPPPGVGILSYPPSCDIEGGASGARQFGRERVRGGSDYR